MFNIYVTQCLLIDNTLAALKNIRVMAEVACYWATMTDMQLARQALANTEDKLY